MAWPRPTKLTRPVFLVGTVDGVYGFFQSDNQGNTWTRINDDQHQFGTVYGLTGDPRIYGRVYVGTAGRGAVYADPLSPLPVILQVSGAATSLDLQYLSASGFDFVIERATNLWANGSFNVWSAVITNAGTGGPLNFSNSLDGPQQFFRVRVQPPQ